MLQPEVYVLVTSVISVDVFVVGDGAASVLQSQLLSRHPQLLELDAVELLATGLSSALHARHPPACS